MGGVAPEDRYNVDVAARPHEHVKNPQAIRAVITKQNPERSLDFRAVTARRKS